MSCRVFQFLLCIAIVIFCIAFLAVATFVNLRHGPGTDPVKLHLSSFTIKNIRQLPSRKFVISWKGELRLVNQKSSLHVRILRTATTLIYTNAPLSCGLANNTRIHIGPQEEKTLPIQYDPGGCEFHHPFLKGQSPKDVAAALKRADFAMGLSMTFYAYYKYNTWGWNVLLNPFCDNLVLKYDNKHDEWRYVEGNGTISTCQVPPPVSYI